MDSFHWLLIVLLIVGLIAWLIDDRKQRSTIKAYRKIIDVNAKANKDEEQSRRILLASIASKQQKIDQLTAFISGIGNQVDGVLNDDDRPF